MRRNPLTVTGVPTLIPGMLTRDTDQALRFAAGQSFSAADSVSLSVTGSMSIEFLFSVPALPGANANIIAKTGSYVLQIRTDGKLQLDLTGPSSSVSLVSATALVPGRRYHVVAVYNGNYAGTPEFGSTTLTTGTPLQAELTKFATGSSALNKQVSLHTSPEVGLVTAMQMPLARDDEVWTCEIRMVAYADAAGVPGGLLVQSDPLVIPSIPVRNPTFQWYTFPAAGIIPAGPIWLGYQAKRTNGQQWTAFAASSSTRAIADSFDDGAAATFGAGTLTASMLLAALVDYTPIARTGLEGKALLYIDGALDASAVYAGGIADTANALVIGGAGYDVDEGSIWGRALSPVEIGSHYTAH